MYYLLTDFLTVEFYYSTE